jgi:hypothetical protein
MQDLISVSIDVEIFMYTSVHEMQHKLVLLLHEINKEGN